MADSGQWRALSAVIKKQFPTAIITSSYRAGSTGSNGGADYHSSGNAIDIGGPIVPQVFDWLVKTYPGSEEIIYTPGGNRQIKNGAPHVYSQSVAVGHLTHVHWAALNLDAARTGKGGTNASNASLGGDVAGAVAGELVPGLGNFLSFITNPGMWARVACALGGLLLLMIGLVRLASPGIARTVRTAVPVVRAL